MPLITDTVSNKEIQIYKAIPANSLVSVTPAASATVTVEYTVSSLPTVESNLATWVSWPIGALSTPTKASDKTETLVHIRVASTGGAAAVEINTEPTNDLLEPFNKDWGSAENRVLYQNIGGSTPAVLTNPTYQATNSVNNYTQIAIQNKSAGVNASADHIAYPDNVTSSDLTGFIDVGITSSGFAQAAYAITGQNECYVFASAPSGAGKTGDMVVATDSTGSSNSIWFGTGGFSALANRRAGFVGANFRPYTNASCGLGAANIGFTKLYMDFTNTGTIGAVTINKASGRVNVAAAASSVVVTNSVVTANSKVFCSISQNDTTAILKNVIPTAGSFTINLNAAATANTSIDFFVVNAD